MRVRVINHLDDLTSDLRKIAVRSHADMVGVVRDGIRLGSQEARRFAKRSAGEHGKHYPRSITWEIKTQSFGAIIGEYGPDPALPQGGMSFEHGSRNQPPHNDLKKSADLIGPAFAREVRELPSRWFWAGGDS